MKNQILVVTEKILKEEGYQKVTVRKIASSLNISSTAIYRHFKNTADLFLCLILIESKKLAIELTENIDMSQENLYGTICTLAERYVKYAKNNPHVFDLLFLSPYSLKTVDFDLLSPFETLKVFSEMIRAMKDVYNLEVSYEVLLAQAWSFIFGYAVLVREQSLEYDPEVTENLLQKVIAAEA